MAKMEHYKKKVKRDKLSELLGLLKQHGRLRSSVLEKKLGVSSPTLSAYLRELKRENKIEEDLTVKDEDRRKKFYRIKSESQKDVEAELGKFEAIRFIDAISDPVYCYEEDKDGGKAIAAFVSRIDPRVDGVAEKMTNQIVKQYLKFLRMATLLPNQKIAVVIMVKGKGNLA